MMEEEVDLRDQKQRLLVLQGIKSEENISRKREQQKRYDVYNDQQDVYILERLRREFSEKTVQEMRKIFSVNLSKRIIDKRSSVYLEEPERIFSRESGVELSENEQAQLESLYENLPVDQTMKRANVLKNLHQQCAIMCVPDMKGGFKLRAIHPTHYDVVPSVNDPEVAHAYILNVWDKDFRATATGRDSEVTQLSQYRENDRANQSIADDNDRQAELERYIVWTAEYHFVMDGRGKIKGELMENPIGMLPFIDVAPQDKDFQFFVRAGSGTVEFSLDFGLLLSDMANVIRLQSYSQAVIVSEKIPENTTVGPNHIMHLKLDRKNPELTPQFQFVTPSPDLAGTQNFLDSILNLHLTSLGLDPSVVNARGDAEKFSSGIDRLLSMISKFEASKDDFALFRGVEDELLELLIAWSNHFQNVVGDGALKDKFKGAILPDDIQSNVQYATPNAVETRKEQVENLSLERDGGYKSRIDILMSINNVDRDKAIEIAEQIDEDESLYGDFKKVELPELPEEEAEEDLEETEDVGTNVQEDESKAEDQS